MPRCYTCKFFNLCDICHGNFRKNLTERCDCLEGYQENGIDKNCYPCALKCITCDYPDIYTKNKIPFIFCLIVKSAGVLTD